MKKLEALPLDPIFVRLNEFRADKNPRKINLGIGIYADDKGRPYVMPSVQKAAKNLDCSNFNYTSMQGDTEFLDLVQGFFLGKHDFEIAQIQTVGGTHAVKLFGNLAKKWGVKKYILPTPTWGNYRALLVHEEIIDFPHLTANGEVNFRRLAGHSAGYLETLENLDSPEETVLVLQGGQPHNQTGKNLSLAQLQELIPLLNKKGVHVLIDAAYIGLGAEIKFTPSGVAGRDLEFVRTAFRDLEKVALAVSFSKNACLYRHRCGALFIKTDDQKPREILESHLQVDTRTTISNPPAFGAMVMKDIFANNLDDWLAEVAEMKASIDARREFLINSLDGKLDYLRDCRGMFGVLQVSPAQITELREKYAIYMLDSGRINFAGISNANRDYLVESLRAVL